MNFLNPEWFWALGVLPLFIMFAWIQRQKVEKLRKQWFDDALWQKLTPSTQSTKPLGLLLLWLGIMSFLIISLTQPRWGYQWEEVQQKGTDLLIALDVSKSMLAQDVSPDRLTRAKREILDLLNLLEGDRVGLVAFAGVSFLQSPLTQDYSAIELFLDEMNTDVIPVQGTSLSPILETAKQAFRKTPKDARAIILITDGEEHADSYESVIKDAQAEEIPFFVMGVGSTEGAPIPEEGGGFLKSDSGELVVSQLNPSALETLASSTGGRYVPSVASDQDWKILYHQGIKGQTESQELGTQRKKLWNEQFQWFLGAALILLGVRTAW